MSVEYRNNHYVPKWYQRRFLAPATDELLYRDLTPGTFRDGRGIAHSYPAIRRLGFKYGFAQEDLYTTFLRATPSTAIEQQFFGTIDNRGRIAVDYLASFSHPWDGKDFLEDMVLYMSTQKLRTPKGIGWLQKLSAGSGVSPLTLMVRNRSLFGAVWTECVWMIASAEQSGTKFIVSDHPVTVYNRRCGPKSSWCRDYDDPDVRYHATHTLFPLSLDKILILTNLSWARNPYQSEVGMRPNPQLYREKLFEILEIQTLRLLSEQEVREINFIIKSRAFRYIASANEDWLFPERYVSKSDWRNFGQGYLLMPDPRTLRYAAEFVATFKDGSSVAIDEFGRTPSHPEYSGHRKALGNDWNSFQRFKAEFARLFGPSRRGRAFGTMRLDVERDSEKVHQDRLDSEALWKRRMTGGGR